MCKRVPEMKKFAFEDFKNCVLLSTRLILMTTDNGVNPFILCAGDFLPHNDSGSSEWRYNPSNKCFQLQAV
jgi:hypothetical protein